MFAELGRESRTLTDSIRSRNHLAGVRRRTALHWAKIASAIAFVEVRIALDNQLDEAVENVAKGSRRLGLARFVGLHTRSEPVCINQYDIEVLVLFIPSRWVAPPRE